MRVQPLMVGFVLVATCALLPAGCQAAQSVSALTTSSNADIGQGITLSMAGELLTGVAQIVVILSQGVIVWATWVSPGAVLGGLRFLRRAQRQIDANEPHDSDPPYGTEELIELRWLAEDRVSRSRSRVLLWAARIGAVAVLAFFVGIVLAPPFFGAGVMAEAATQVFRYLGLVFVLVGVITAMRSSWHTSTDAKAQAFLDRTATVLEERSLPEH